MARFRILLIAAFAALAALALAACGGDDGGGGESDADPATVLRETFSNDQSVESGVFDVSLQITAEGGSDPGTLRADLGGPFQSAEGEFPQFDVDGEAELESESQDFSGSAGLTSTGDAAFVTFQDTDYEVPQAVFQEFTSTFLQLQQRSAREGGNANLLGSLGIDPTTWLTDLTNDGLEDVDGTETIHISGTPDVPKLLADFRKLAESAPQAAQRLEPGQLAELAELADVVDDAELSVYSGEDDRILRKLEATLQLGPPQDSGEDAPETIEVTFALTLSDVNDPQEISGPTDAQPLDELLGQFGLSSGALGGGAAPQAGGSPTAPSDDATAAYLQCLAETQGAGEECAELLEQ